MAEPMLVRDPYSRIRSPGRLLLALRGPGEQVEFEQGWPVSYQSPGISCAVRWENERQGQLWYDPVVFGPSPNRPEPHHELQLLPLHATYEGLVTILCDGIDSSSHSETCLYMSGSLRSCELEGAITEYRYDAQGRLIERGNERYRYDWRGRWTGLSLDYGSWGEQFTLEYDWRGRLAAIEQSQGEVTLRYPVVWP